MKIVLELIMRSGVNPSTEDFIGMLVDQAEMIVDLEEKLQAACRGAPGPSAIPMIRKVIYADAPQQELQIGQVLLNDDESLTIYVAGPRP